MSNLTPAQQVIAGNMSEAELQDNIIAMAKQYGWLVHAERPAVNQRGKWVTPIQGDKGFPDVFGVKPPRILIIEDKSKAGSLSAAQEKWIIALAGCPAVKVMVARPENWEEILAVITIKRKEGI